jgi:hypothetical protein
MNSPIDIARLRTQVDTLRAAHPELWEDDDDRFLVDVLEGQTDLHAMLASIVDRMHVDGAMSNGLRFLMETYKTRRDRYDARVEALRALAFQLMQMADVPKLTLPHATLSIRNGPPKVVIVDEASIPENYIRIKREPNKSLIREHIQQGIDVPGASLSNSEPVLALHTK